MNKTSSYFLVFLCLLLAIVMFVSDQSSNKLAQNKGALLEEEIANQYLRQDINSLKRDVYNLYHSPEVVEKYSRELYAFSRPDEKVIFFTE